MRGALALASRSRQGVDSKQAGNLLDTLANYVCTHGITPGCQVLVARRGKVIYQRSFGNLTYPSKDPLAHAGAGYGQLPLRHSLHHQSSRHLASYHVLCKSAVC